LDFFFFFFFFFSGAGLLAGYGITCCHVSVRGAGWVLFCHHLAPPPSQSMRGPGQDPPIHAP